MCMQAALIYHHSTLQYEGIPLQPFFFSYNTVVNSYMRDQHFHIGWAL